MQFQIKIFMAIALFCAFASGCEERVSRDASRVKWDSKTALSDAEMEASFRLNRRAFDRLVMMLGEDKKLEYFHRGGMCMPELPEERRDEYAKALDEAGFKWAVIKCVRDGRDMTINIIPSHPGKDDILKIFVYLTAAPSPLKDNLDAASQTLMGEDERWYKKLAGNWYLVADNLNIVRE